MTLFTIGPVQSFIAKARKLQDLYAGSYLLSHLSKQTMRHARDKGAKILFPDPDKPSAPNRFLMIVEAPDPDALRAFCRELEAFVRNEWAEIAEKAIVGNNLAYSPAVSAQVDSFIQVYYASEEYKGGAEFVDHYVKAIKRLGAAKTLRDFPRLDEPAGRKCSLMHEHNALFYRETRNYYLVQDAQKVGARHVGGIDKYIRQEETLGAVSFVKRCLRSALPEFEDAFPSVTDIYEMHGDRLKEDEEKHGYYALLLFDGDDMGKWYSTPHEKDVERGEIERFQAYLSREISNFAAVEARRIVNWNEKKAGVVIYAGGEDFLGALHLRDAFSALRELRETFGNIDISAYTPEKLSFSAGVVVAHVKTPLSAVLEMAREAEHAAKARPGKDAFCLTIAKRSGDGIQFTQPFYYGEGKSSLDAFDRLVEILVQEKLSTKFIYQLSEELERIAETGDAALRRAIFLAEAQRLLRHSAFESKEKREAIVAEVMGILTLLADDSGFAMPNLLMYLRAVAFIARERGAVS